MQTSHAEEPPQQCRRPRLLGSQAACHREDLKVRDAAPLARVASAHGPPARIPLAPGLAGRRGCGERCRLRAKAHCSPSSHGRAEHTPAAWFGGVCVLSGSDA
eukprot:scaffold116423_cov29-Tisochrysis_lutea.AAC.1